MSTMDKKSDLYWIMKRTQPNQENVKIQKVNTKLFREQDYLDLKAEIREEFEEF